MVNNKKYSTGMTNGNVAYEIQPQKKEKINKKPHRKAKKKSIIKFKIMATVMVIALFSFLTLCRYATIINMSKDVITLKADIKAMQMENENTMVKLAKLNNMKNIEKVAVSKFGMVVPQKDNVVYLDVKELTTSEEMPKQTAFQAIQKVLGITY